MSRGMSILVLLMVAGVASPSLSAAGQRASNPAVSTTLPRASEPEITSPKHRDSVPRQGIDPPCKAGPGCSLVTVEGKIPQGSFPFLAVAPVQASPRIWIQPRVTGVRRDGAFEGVVYLGSDKIGIGERFTIFVFGCKDERRFRYDEVIEATPKDCLVSEPVTVTRTK